MVALETAGETGILQVMRRRLATAITVAVLILVLTSNGLREATAHSRTHCIVDELATAGFFNP